MNCMCGRSMPIYVISGIRCHFCIWCYLAIKIEDEKMSCMKIWKEATKWITKGWKGERDKVKKDGRESSVNCKYGDKAFSHWLAMNHPLVYGEYRAMFFMDVGSNKK